MKHFFSITDGIGAIAAESYVRLTNHRVKIAKDQDYLNYILVDDAQIPGRTAYIMDHSKPNFFCDSKDDVLSQAKLNPDFFVMPCSTAHYFYGDLAALADVPFPHMIRIAVHTFIDNFPKGKKISLIATEGSIYNHLYMDELEHANKKIELGDSEIQPMVDELIYSDTREKGIADHDLYHKILKTMHDKYGCNVILLGCTGLSLVQKEAPDHPYNVIDPQSIIADVSIELALKIRNGMDPKEVTAKYMYKQDQTSQSWTAERLFWYKKDTDTRD